MKKVLIITRNLPPLIGGMERLNWHMADELSNYTEVKVIGPKGSAAIKPTNVQISASPLKPLILFMLIALVKALWVSLSFKPNIILAGSGLTAPLAWLASRIIGVKATAYLHGLDITASSKLYQTFWVPFLKRMDNVIVNSTATKKLALNIGIKEEKITIVNPGVKLPLNLPAEDEIQKFKHEYNLKNKKIILSVGRFTTRKGLKEFVEKSMPYIIKEERNAILVIVGEPPKNSLSAEIQSRESIEQVAQTNAVESNIRFLGKVDERTLELALRSANVHIFPIRDIKNDPEGFGMVAIEAAAYGVPTVAFATGGVIDAVADNQSGYLVNSGDYLMLASKTIQIIQSDKKKWQNSSLSFAKKFAWHNFGMKILICLQQGFEEK